MEEIVPSPYLNEEIYSIQECREYCLNRSCISFSYQEHVTRCLIHDGHRYNKHFKFWWVKSGSDKKLIRFI
ncbi:hypothetical protein KUTeg_020673 [Tegillarca granosa]|uniref:Apple domain-containing protein n=1 Tax=Tegillarca granosa TaxID=220873 RepID=A0ABQ9E8M1_TEGGR|nr:hypothetical protein KUTeg_020673 [Tegillarca granosa]